MAYAAAIGACLVCHKPFSFNPVRVPSFRVNGSKEPICSGCIENINRKRVELGIKPFVIAPDAYDACDESELD